MEADINTKTSRLGVPDTLQPPPIPDHQLLQRIGRGSYGEVWLARSVTGAYRAVKIVHRQAFDHDRPFEREFNGIVRFEPISRGHESQVDILHVGRGESCFFYVMELADDQFSGQQIDPDHYAPRTLKSELFQRGKLPFEECVQLSLALTTALENLHSHSLVHRDIKPSNIIFVNGIPKLADIGLVTGVDATRSHVGTEGFAPPEGAGTPQADVYSLGKVLYELCTGKDRQEFPELPTDLSERPDREGLLELNVVIARACRQDPRERYQSALAMHNDLVLLQSGKSLARLHAAERTVAKLKRAGLIVVSVAGLSAGLFLWQVRETTQMKKLAADNLRLAKMSQQSASEARESLRQMQVANGVGLMNQGDLYPALVWLGKALQLLPDDPAREQPDRIRFESVLRRCPKLIHVFAHDGRVNWCEISPDGKRALTASADHTARLWDMESGEQLGAPLQHEYAVLVATFSPDGSRVATASCDWTARVWDAATGEPSSPPLNHTNTVTHVAFSPDGKLVLTASLDNTARVWDATTGQAVSPSLCHSDAVMYAEFSPDGQRVVTASLDKTARVWDARTGQPLTEPLRHEGEVRHASFSPDGKRIATGAVHALNGLEGEALVWEAEAGTPLIAPIRIKSHVVWICFSPDGRRIAAGGFQGAGVWDAQTGTPITPFLSDPRIIAQIAFSPDGGRIVTASESGGARVRDAASGKPLTPELPHGGKALHAVFSRDGTQLLTCSDDGTAKLWDLTIPPASSLLFQHPAPLAAVALSHDGKRIATASTASVIFLWDISSGKLIFEHPEPVRLGTVGLVAFSPDDRRILITTGPPYEADGGLSYAEVLDATTGTPVLPPLRHQDIVHHAAFSPDGSRIVTASLDHTAQLWDAITGLPFGPPLQHEAGVYYASFSPDGRQVVTASIDRSARVWDVATGQPVLEPLLHTEAVHYASFSPDGSRIVTAGEDQSAFIWDAATGRPLGSPFKAGGTVWGATFSPDSRRLVTFGVSTSARVWDIAHGTLAFPPLAHNGHVHPVQFSRDGRWLLTASGDGLARVWDAITGEPVTPGLDQGDEGKGAGFSPDGLRVVTGGSDRTAQVWELRSNKLPKAELLSLAELLAGHELEQTGAMRPLKPKELKSLLQALRSTCPDFFNRSPESVLAWHRQMLERTTCSFEVSPAIEQALWHLDSLLKAQPMDLDLLRRRSDVHAELKHWDAATVDAAQMLQAGAGQAATLRRLACLNWARGDSNGYRQAAEKVIQLAVTTEDPGDVGRAVSTTLLEFEPRPELAAFERVLRRGAAEDTRDWEHLHRLGWLLCRNGKYGEAQEELLRARQAWPESPWALFIGAQVETKLGHEKEAHQLFDRAAAAVEAQRKRLWWYQKLELQALRRSTEALLRGDLRIISGP
jgi:WD40 repeat protein